ncbi:MAG: pyrimidine dimer DNA glycosylase/endonuclease V [Candidatus Omnitrophica bacterium]|nr:pyrimidine dimer DNA glycosylase/endonuclease V [Candidatus Omnitrophota bacterium]
MRLWSIHPRYLDRAGLLALWRESLLAQKVLQGKTKGYTNHPQLERFKKHPQPLYAIGFYLYQIYKEGLKRKYAFNKHKILFCVKPNLIKVNRGQVLFEFKHLLNKLKVRSPHKYRELSKIKIIRLNPLFFQRSE